MTLLVGLQQLRLYSEQIFKVVSETCQNCKLFDTCIFENIPQLGLLVSS